MKSVMVVTGEASGDLHGANLVRAMQKKNPHLSFVGMGGEELAESGVKILFDAKKVSVVGIAEVLSHLPDIRKARKLLRQYLKDNRPDLLIIIDLPDFNLMLAKSAKELGIPVFYYICPQVWAWRSGRVKTISERVDRVGVILPFEEQYLRDRGVEANYVGHPLLDTVATTGSRKEFLAQNEIPEGNRCIGLLPGSRSKEISALLPDFLKAAELVQEKIDEPVTFLLPLASTITEEEVFEHGLKAYQDKLDIQVIRGQRYDLMAACDAVVAASGTVTLELALLDTPMVVTYKLSPLTYYLGRMLIKLEHFSLVNLIAGYEVVPELLQKEVCPDTIADKLHELVTSSNTRATMKQGLAEVRARLGREGASERAAELALGML